jgi:hypothetical protein
VGEYGTARVYGEVLVHPVPARRATARRATARQVRAQLRTSRQKTLARLPDEIAVRSEGPVAIAVGRGSLEAALPHPLHRVAAKRYGELHRGPKGLSE